MITSAMAPRPCSPPSTLPPARLSARACRPIATVRVTTLELVLLRPQRPKACRVPGQQEGVGLEFIREPRRHTGLPRGAKLFDLGDKRMQRLVVRIHRQRKACVAFGIFVTAADLR